MSPYDPERHGPARIVGPGFFARVYDIVKAVPPGRVTTYGDVAHALGSRSVARKVGHALAGLPAERDDVPWHRVVNAKGTLGHAPNSPGSRRQRARLREEGVKVDPSGRIPEFARLRYRP